MADRRTTGIAGIIMDLSIAATKGCGEGCPGSISGTIWDRIKHVETDRDLAHHADGVSVANRRHESQLLLSNLDSDVIQPLPAAGRDKLHIFRITGRGDAHAQYGSAGFLYANRYRGVIVLHTSELRQVRTESRIRTPLRVCHRKNIDGDQIAPSGTATRAQACFGGRPAAQVGKLGELNNHVAAWHDIENAIVRGHDVGEHAAA